MKKHSFTQPFGFHFCEESIPNTKDLVIIYDENLSLNVVEIGSGELTPIVEINDDNHIKTQTRTQDEENDNDFLFGCQVKTRTFDEPEVSDDDDAFSSKLSNLKTATSTENETSGEDDDLYQRYLNFSFVKTATKSEKEISDEDE
jgi:hypothetical protein